MGIEVTSGLNVDLIVSRGDFTLESSLQVAVGETLALLGPNGSGKSTMLQAIAGLLAPQHGSVRVNGRTLTRVGAPGRDGERRIAVAPHERNIGLLGQDPLLFPHLSALENVGFGARARGESAAQARGKAAAWLEAVDLVGFENRRPAQLSGGQQQRVAIARALAAEPDVLLLDEPMAALDVQNATAVRTLLRERLGAIPTVIVTHDVVDAMVLADRVAILHEGRIVDSGTPDDVLGRPKSPFAASLVGLNLMEGTLKADGTVHCTDSRRLRSGVVGPNSASSGNQEAPIGAWVAAAFPPSGVRISADSREGSDSLSWRATVGPLEPAVRGIRVPFVGDSIVAEVTTAELLVSGIREGMPVTVTVDPEFVTVYRMPDRGRQLAG